MAQEEKEHTDILGQPVNMGSYMAICHKNTLKVCSVVKITNKMIRIRPIGNRFSDFEGYLVYANQGVILSGPDALSYILKNA